MRHRAGFTLIELLIVMAIIGVLLALFAGVVVQVREAANRTQCASNLAQLGKATHNYISERQRMPPYASGGPDEIFGGWLVHLLPYLEQQAAYDELQKQLTPPPSAPFKILTAGSAGQVEINFPTLMCPSDPHFGASVSRTTYLANWYAFAAGNEGFYFKPPRLAALSDGLSSTIFFAEGYSLCDGLPRWAQYPVYYHNFGITQDGIPSDDPSYLPDDYTMFQVQPRLNACDKQRTQTPHTSMTVCLGDGSVRTVGSGIAPLVWKQVLKPNDGLPAGSDW